MAPNRTRFCIKCGKKKQTHPAVSLHLFPTDTKRRLQWLQNLNIAYVTASSVVCSDHFSQCYHGAKGKLFSTAVPTPHGRSKKHNPAPTEDPFGPSSSGTAQGRALDVPVISDTTTPVPQHHAPAEQPEAVQEIPDVPDPASAASSAEQPDTESIQQEVISCSALNCQSNTKDCPDYSFFSFPINEERCKIWIQNSRREDLLEKSSVYLHLNCTLCPEHFVRSQFVDEKRERLVGSAVPTLFSTQSLPAAVADPKHSEVPHMVASHDPDPQKFITLVPTDANVAKSTVNITNTFPVAIKQVNPGDNNSVTFTTEQKNQISPKPYSSTVQNSPKPISSNTKIPLRTGVAKIRVSSNLFPSDTQNVKNLQPVEVNSSPPKLNTGQPVEVNSSPPKLNTGQPVEVNSSPKLKTCPAPWRLGDEYWVEAPLPLPLLNTTPMFAQQQHTAPPVTALPPQSANLLSGTPEPAQPTGYLTGTSDDLYKSMQSCSKMMIKKKHAGVIRRHRRRYKELLVKYRDMLNKYQHLLGFGGPRQILRAAQKFLSDEQIVLLENQMLTRNKVKQGNRYSKKFMFLMLQYYRRSKPGYQYLRKIFTLPSKHVIYRFTRNPRFSLYEDQGLPMGFMAESDPVNMTARVKKAVTSLKEQVSDQFLQVSTEESTNLESKTDKYEQEKQTDRVKKAVTRPREQVSGQAPQDNTEVSSSESDLDDHDAPAVGSDHTDSEYYDSEASSVLAGSSDEISEETSAGNKSCRSRNHGVRLGIALEWEEVDDQPSSIYK